MKRNNFQVMRELLVLAKPLAGTMVLAVALGVMGNLCAIMIPVLGGYALVGRSIRHTMVLLPFLAVFRGIFHYLEQNRNHYLAFKLLALIRDKVFGALRRLAPAKLEGKEKGNMIAVLTADIELLEVFYAHTISPICIAFLVSAIMTTLIGSFHPLLGLLALISYCVIGILVPLVAAKRSRVFGEGFRKEFGELDSFVLDSLRGLYESIQYQAGQKRLEEIYRHSDSLAEKEKKLKGAGGTNSAITGGTVLVLDLLMLFTALYLYRAKAIGFPEAVLSVIALMSSFGPTIALANLGTGLQSTFAAGNRVLDILEEEPVVEEITDGKDISFDSACCQNVSFSYEKENTAGSDRSSGGANDRRDDSTCVKEYTDDNDFSIDGVNDRKDNLTCDKEKILQHLSLQIPRGKIIGITGKSGSGKSTLLKLLMRFWDADSGKISLSDTNIQAINTASLRKAESFVAQDTQLFHDSIERNLLIANPHATREQVIEACRKASIHDRIMTFPKGYDTEVGELGETLSGGERQRLGIARAFLHDAPLILLDEPTSNLDSLNEAVILKSIRDYRENKTFVLVSHRKSTMCIADETYSVENGRMS